LRESAMRRHLSASTNLGPELFVRHTYTYRRYITTAA
jgi:hypothetical protein